MNHWDSIRAKAREVHELLAKRAGNDRSPEALLSAASSLTGIERFPLPNGDPLLYGAADAVLHSGAVWYNADVLPWQILFFQAHEFSHHWLHNDICVCADCSMDAEATEDELGFGVQRVEGYGPHERRELEANVFARELLLPTSLLRAYFLDDRRTAVQIAAMTQMPEGLICHQLCRGLLGPQPTSKPDEATPDSRPLDPSQSVAARAEKGPVLVQAGPGTGKTRTLVARAVDLLTEKKIHPEHILTLTFSNKAAEEMRTRIGAAAPEFARRLWMGTFHAFGLELLRKYGTRIGLAPKPLVIDPVDAIDLLETSLDELDLSYYQHLSEPTYYLRDILAAISRAKDELVGPDEYMVLAQSMLERAGNEDETDKARKAIEVASAYAAYEAILQRGNFVDYGDLILKSALLLRTQTDVRDELRQQFKQILVDEYQDVNTASKVLLKELSGDGAGLWVVGDALQAIYRFRGAAPGNMREFRDDYPGAVILPLELNYRSQKHITTAFSAFAKTMTARTPDMFTDWRPGRKEADGSLSYEIAVDETAEARGIAEEIERLRSLGVSYKDQAVLSRSHTILQRIAVVLEREGIPLFYLGDLFERTEVRDLLSLVSLASEPAGNGLLRVADFTEYAIPREDVLIFVRHAKANGLYFPKAFEIVGEVEGLSDVGRQQLLLLWSHLQGYCYGTSGWTFLTTYLFNKSGFLLSYCSDTTVSGMQKRLAVYQLLQFAHHMRGRKARVEKTDPKREFLNYVRRLELWGEERPLRQVPSWANDIDAVRMLTVHSAKGLEFRAVFIPSLGNGKFPTKGQYEFCPPPEGLIRGGTGWRLEEEECLFFVALSRAEDWLCLSRAQRYGKQNSNPSDFLTNIASLLSSPVDGSPTWIRTDPQADTTPVPETDPTKIYTVAELGKYDVCPHQFYIEEMLSVRGSRDDSGYLRFHQCVRHTFKQLREEYRTGNRVEVERANEMLDGHWQQRGPKGHVHERLYRREAERMTREMATAMLSASSERLDVEWTVPLRNGRVSVSPDWVEVIETSAGKRVVVRRLKTGRAPKKFTPEDVVGLYVKGAEQEFPDAERVFEVQFLMTNEILSVDLSPKTLKARLATYETAIDNIARGEFNPTPADRVCPKCAQYFACPIRMVKP